jgi:hypothetical protein
MDKEFVARALRCAETSDWFNWLRRELPLGGIVLPEDETTVWIIERVLHLGSRLEYIYRHVPPGLRLEMLQSALVFGCWKNNRDLRERSKVPRWREILPTVSANKHLGRLGGSGQHHLVEANDGFKYVVSVPSGLWIEAVPATEIICNALARRMGLTVPSPAIVAVDTDILRQMDKDGPLRPFTRAKQGPRHCCGFRFIEPSADSGVSRAPVRDREQMLGALLFDCWVANFRSGRFVVAKSDALRGYKPIFFDHARCLAGADWGRYMARYQHFKVCGKVNLVPEDRRILEKWFRRISDLDMNPIWDLVFQIPRGWYGSRSARVGELLDDISIRRTYLRSEIHALMCAPGHNARDARDCSSRDCVAGIGCRLPSPLSKLSEHQPEQCPLLPKLSERQPEQRPSFPCEGNA